VPKRVPPISIHTDSRFAVELLKQVKIEQAYSDQMKSVKYLMGKTVILNFVKSKKNIVDPLTKGLSRSAVQDTSREMGLSPI